MISLDNPSALKEHDPSDMASLISSFPEQCRDANRLGILSDIPDSFKRRYANIVCSGMGGSAIGADIARSYTADESATPISVNRHYKLPAFVGKGSLVIISSYSGNDNNSNNNQTKIFLYNRNISKEITP